MKLTEMKLHEFNDAVASKAPAPGGGSVAALTAANGAALTAMVAKLTGGKKKYAEHDALMQEIIEESEKLTAELMACVDKDTEAYNGVSAVFDMPKNTDEEKAARSEAMQKALEAAVLVPLRVMELCLDALKITDKAVGKSNVNAASDLGVAALNLSTGSLGAHLNVKINLSGIKNEAFVNKYKPLCLEMYEAAYTLSESIYNRILNEL